MNTYSRRRFLQASAAALAGAAAGRARGQPPPWTAQQHLPRPAGIEVLYPRQRIPLSFFIDDSTCLVNLAHYAMPQFAVARAGQDSYQKPWKSWPREIPDAFMREFGQWCAEHGVKGKYSIVPYPACVGWLDRELPGWSRRELEESLQLVRELMAPNWDIHPEMITHTRVIDLKTGRPFEEISAATMENSYPQTDKSADELADYMAYALRILRNCGLPCEGITTPGGFGTRVKTELSLATQQAVRDVYGAEIPHYFKYIVSSGDQNLEPKLEHVSGVGGDDLRLTVSVTAGTGDWFGGWDGDRVPEGHLYANEDATSGRMVELIEQGQPAIMLCHWPGLYNNGSKIGFEAFQKVAVALQQRYSRRTQWMKISEIARYWAAKELTHIDAGADGVTLDAPLACPQFTLRWGGGRTSAPQLILAGAPAPLKQVSGADQLQSGTWLAAEDGAVLCFDLPRGRTILKT